MYWVIYVGLFVGTVNACFNNDDTTCTSCVHQSNASMICVWCYHDSQCKQWTTTMPCTNSSDISFGGQQCECRPETEQSCSTCTKKHNCVWLEDSEIHVTTVLTSNSGAEKVNKFELNSGSSCWAGDLFSGPTWTDWTIEGPHLSVHAHLHGDLWSWGQCNISGVWMVIIIFILVFLSLLGFAYCFKTVMDRRRMKVEIVSPAEPLLLMADPDRPAIEYVHSTEGQRRD